MRYPDGGGLSAAGRTRRERVRLQAAQLFEQDMKPVQVAHQLRVSTKKGSGRVSAAGLACFKPGSRSRFFYRIRIHRGRKGERSKRSASPSPSLGPRNPIAA